MRWLCLWPTTSIFPADVRRMELQDKDRYERIRETLGEHCTVLEFARVDEGDAVKWAVETANAEAVKLDADAARELVDSLGGDMMMVANELEKLVLFVGDKKRITLGDVETMVLGGQAALVLRTDRRHLGPRSRPRACRARCHPEHWRRRRSRHRPSLHAVADLPADAGDLRAQRARHPGAVAGAVAGVPVATVRGRRRHSSGAALQVTTRAYQRDPEIARADLALRSNPVSKRLVLENLVLELTAEPKAVEAGWFQEQLPV